MTPFQTVHFTKLSILTEAITHLRLYDGIQISPRKIPLNQTPTRKKPIRKTPSRKTPQNTFLRILSYRYTPAPSDNSPEENSSGYNFSYHFLKTVLT